jgi:hypothetical protein
MTDDRGKETKERKVRFHLFESPNILIAFQIYQINAHTIKVLAESDEYVETRTRPIAPNSGERTMAKLPQRAAPASFDQFVVPGLSSSSGSSGGSDHTLDLEMEDDGKKPKKGKKPRKEF